MVGLAQSSSALATGNQGFIGNLNDVRIYDHCLSAKEVKEIAQGLILHYKLDNDFTSFGNLLENGDGSLGTTYWSSTTTSTNDLPPASGAKLTFKGGTHSEYIPIYPNHSYTISA